MAHEGSVLIVDDEVAPRESLRMIFYPLYQVYTAADGREALAFLQNQQIDLITLDMKMPGLSGMDVLKEIKNMKPDVEVVIISGYMTPKTTQEAKEYGAADIITKPFDVTEVVARVAKLVEQRKYSRKVKSLLQAIRGLRTLDEKEIDEFLYN